jgi:hypothetical protein
MLKLGEGLSDHKIKLLVQEKLMAEYVKRLEAKLLTDVKLEKVSPGLGKLLNMQLRTVLILQQMRDQVKRDLENRLETYRAELREKHKIKSRISEWLEDLVETERVCKKNISSYLLI